MSSRQRKTWQHDIARISESQLSEAFHAQGWELDAPSGDYGEDFAVRIFEDGNPTGEIFFVQLKGTKNIEEYSLKDGRLRYTVSLTEIRQWAEHDIPMVFIIWDTIHRQGFWVHVQSFVTDKVSKVDDWLTRPSTSRQIHVQKNQIITNSACDDLKKVIQNEFRKIRISKIAIFETQKDQLENLQQSIINKQNNRFEHLLGDAAPSLQPLPPQIAQQVRIASLQSAASETPGDQRLWTALAEAFYEAGDFNQALQAINSSWEIDSTIAHVRAVRGMIVAEYARANSNPKHLLLEAIKLFESVRTDDEPNTHLEYNIGNCFHALGQTDQAIEYFNIALSTCTDPILKSKILKNQGSCFCESGDTERGIRCFKESLGHNPKLYEAYVSWALTELSIGNFEQSQELFKEGFRQYPQMAVSGSVYLFWLAYVLWRQGKSTESLSFLNTYLRARPDSSDAIELKSHLLAYLWRQDETYLLEASEHFQIVESIDSDNLIAKTELYLIFRSLGSIDQAENVMKSASVTIEAPTQMIYHYALYLNASGKTEEAVKYLKSAYERNPGHHIAHTLGIYLQKLGKYNDAIEFYEHAMDEIEDTSMMLTSIADCYYFLDDFEKCIIICATAVEKYPRNVIFWNNLAMAASKMEFLTVFMTAAAAKQSLEENPKIEDYHLDFFVNRMRDNLSIEQEYRSLTA